LLKTIMLLTVFGASGQIGGLLVQQALDQGHTVRAYVRDPAKLNLTHPAHRAGGRPERPSAHPACHGRRREDEVLEQRN
jgi:nucleoside-diphosphate-sugar epimerase